MSQCITTPTQTQFATLTSSSVSTSFSESITTFPPQLSTIITSICVTSANGTAPPLTTCNPSTITSTLPASSSTETIPVPVTVPVTLTNPTATLFGTSCADTPIPTPPTSDGSSTTAISTPPPSPTPSPSETPVTPLTNATSTFESSSTLPNGSVTVVTETSVYVVTGTATPQGSGSGSGGGKTNVGAIAGGAAGGVALLVVIGLVLWYCFGRKSRFEDELGLNDPMDNISPFPVRHQKHPRGPLDDEVAEPQNEYHFGALSQAPANVVSPSSWNHSAEQGRVGGVSPTGPASMWDPGYGSGHEGAVGAGPGSASSHGYTAASSPYDHAATGPLPLSNSMAPPLNPSYPVHSSQQFSSQSYPAQPYPPHPNAHYPPASVPVGPVPPSARSDSTRGSGTVETTYNSRVPLMVANPDAMYTPYHDPRDTKDPQIYLQADTGYEIRGGGAYAQAGSSSRPPIQHQDAGVSQSSGMSVRPHVMQQQDSAAFAGASSATSGGAAEADSSLRRRRSTDKNQMPSRDRAEGNDEPAPPAYEA